MSVQNLTKPAAHSLAASDAPNIMGADEPALLAAGARSAAKPSRRTSPAEPVHLSLVDGASAKPSASPVRAAHAEFVAALAGHPPRPIPIDADAIDLEDRADHLDKVFGALSVYVAVILDDTAQNIPGSA